MVLLVITCFHFLLVYCCILLLHLCDAAIGIAREHCALANNGLDTMLIEVQSRLFDVGAAVATPLNSSETKKAYTKVRKKEKIPLLSMIRRLIPQ